MMSDSNSDFDLVLTEHHFLNNLFAKIEAAIAAGGTPREEMILLIDELKVHVLQHFEHEEHEGLFQQITARAPRLEPEATLLQQQHDTLRASLEEIAAPLSRQSWKPQDMQDVAQGFQTFAEQFKQHEEGENRLLQEAYDRDVGSKD